VIQRFHHLLTAVLAKQ